MAKQTHPDARMGVYRCGRGWHYGNLPKSTVKGTLARVNVRIRPKEER